jgi:hypothetical protein
MIELPVTDHPEIPVGRYCYGGWHKDENGKSRQGKVCPHWQGTEKGAICKLLKEEHHEYCGFHLVWDQVKECGINLDDEDKCTGERESLEERSVRMIREGYTLIKMTCECGVDMEVWHKGRKNGDSGDNN